MVSSGDPNSKVVGDLQLGDLGFGPRGADHTFDQPALLRASVVNLMCQVDGFHWRRFDWIFLHLRGATGSSFGTSKCGKNQQIIKYPHTYSYNIYRSKLDKLPDKALDAVLASQAGWLET